MSLVRDGSPSSYTICLIKGEIVVIAGIHEQQASESYLNVPALGGSTVLDLLFRKKGIIDNHMLLLILSTFPIAISVLLSSVYPEFIILDCTLPWFGVTEL